MVQGHLERFRHFPWFGPGLEFRRNQRKHRGDQESGHGFMRRKRPENVRMQPGKPDFLVRFTQCRVFGTVVGLVDLATGKCDLGRMMLQCGRSLGQDDTRTSWAVDHRDQHCGIA